MSKDLRPLLLPYGGTSSTPSDWARLITDLFPDIWRRGRRLMHVLTIPAAAKSYEPLQVFESERLLFALVRDPSKYESQSETYASAVIMRLAFGKSIDEPDTESLGRKVLHVVHTVERVASPWSYLVDTFTCLLRLSSWMAPFKQEAQRLHKSELQLFRQLQADVREDMRDGELRESFTRTFLERQSEFGLSNNEGSYVIGTLFEAGAGTTAAAMTSFCLAMCHSPFWQEKLHEEVDRVATDDRTPDFDDLPNLPTVRAIVKEVLRWRPVTAGGVPHQLIKDDSYEGFFLPPGTIVHANQWYFPASPTMLRPLRSLDQTGPSTVKSSCTQGRKNSTPCAGSPQTTLHFASRLRNSPIFRPTPPSASAAAFVPDSTSQSAR